MSADRIAAVHSGGSRKAARKVGWVSEMKPDDGRGSSNSFRSLSLVGYIIIQAITEDRGS